jgi:hypothetical protein
MIRVVAHEMHTGEVKLSIALGAARDTENLCVHRVLEFCHLLQLCIRLQAVGID